MYSSIMVYLIDSFASPVHLRWVQSPTFPPLPPNVNRTFVKTSSGDIELLVSPRTPDARTPTETSKPPVLFIHGGFGHASVWLPWMNYLHRQNYCGTTYAVSLRGHGASWTPGFWPMWALTTKNILAADVVAA